MITRDYYELLLPYQLLLEYGSPEMIEKVRGMVEDCNRDVFNKGKDWHENWAFKMVDYDVDGDKYLKAKQNANRFQRTMLTFCDGEVEKSLIILSDFALKDDRFRFALPTAKFRGIEYTEQKAKSLVSDAEIYMMEIIRTDELNKPSVVTRGGKSLRGIQELSRIEKINVEDQAQFE